MPRAKSSKQKATSSSGHSTPTSGRQPDDYVFFWKPDGNNGWASQWYLSPFTATATIDGAEETLTFPSTEHWMMFQKAILFDDAGMAREIMAVTSTGQSAMAKVRSLGRKVSNFDDKTWHKHREDIVLQGNLHKFRQNAELRQKLMDTGDKQLVEASPRDRIWGVGFGEKSALERFDKWGLNLLGKALMKTRETLWEDIGGNEPTS